MNFLITLPWTLGYWTKAVVCCVAEWRRYAWQNTEVDTLKAAQYTVGQRMDIWFENYTKIKVWPTSHQTYRGYIDNHIKTNIGKIPLGKLTTLELQKLYKKLLSKGRMDRIEAKGQPKGLSPKTVRNIHQIISSAMNFAKAQKLIAVNPADGCALPKLEHREMKTLPAEQLTSFLREAKESGVFEMYYIELATGLRRGELLDLKWKDLAGFTLDTYAHVTTQAQREAAKTMASVLSSAI